MRSVFTSFLLLFVSIAFAQEVKQDTSFLASARAYQISVYDQYIKGQARLYNGTEYHDYLSHNDEHPYFGVDDWSNGSIIYDDESYENVSMFYDLSRDRLITEHMLSGAKIELVTDKISQFIIAGHTFVKLHRDESKVIQEGFYELLYSGKTKVYARREKLLHSQASANDIEYSFEEKTRLFIFKDGTYHSVKSKGSVLDVYKDRKQELRSALSRNKIKYRSNREAAIVRMAAEYDAQSKQ